MGPSEVPLPPDLPNWRVVKEALRELRGKLVNKTTNPQEVGWFMQVIYNTIQSDQCSPGNVSSQLSLLKAKVQAKLKQKLDSACLWYGVVKFLKKVPAEEKDQFMTSTLPAIIEFALKIEDLMKKETVVWSKQQIGGKLVLSRKFVCSIVACFFLCLFHERKKHGKQPVNIINFTSFFKHLPLVTQVAKLRCILHYFECVIQRNMDIEGDVVFHRKVASQRLTLTFTELMECRLALCPLSILTDGQIEDSGREVMQVCFGNKALGGGVLGKSRVQEEIKFCTCPELLASMLFLENMEDNEAIEVSGFEQMSCYRGYGESFQFDGHCSGAFCDSGRFHMVTIDATSYRGKEASKQYEEDNVLRDLNKALIGFCDVTSDRLNASPQRSGAEDGKSTGGSSGSNRRKISASRKVVSDAESCSTTPSWPHQGLLRVVSSTASDKERPREEFGTQVEGSETKFPFSQEEECLWSQFLQTPEGHKHPPSLTQTSSAISTIFPSYEQCGDQSPLEAPVPYTEPSSSTLPISPPSSPLPSHLATSVDDPNLGCENINPFSNPACTSSVFLPINSGTPSVKTEHANDRGSSPLVQSYLSSPIMHAPLSSSPVTTTTESSLSLQSPSFIHSNVNSTTESRAMGHITDLNLPSGEDDSSFQLTDSAIYSGVENLSQVEHVVHKESGLCHFPSPSLHVPSRALPPEPPSPSYSSPSGDVSNDPTAIPCSGHTKFYSDVLGNLATPSSSSGASPLALAATMSTQPFPPPTQFPFRPADHVVNTELDYNCYHSSSNVSSSSKPFPASSSSPWFPATFRPKSKRDRDEGSLIKESSSRSAGSSSFELAESKLVPSSSSSFHSAHHNIVRCLSAEKAGSDISNYSTKVCVGSQSTSMHSLDESCNGSEEGGAPMNHGYALLLDHDDDDGGQNPTQSSFQIDNVSSIPHPYSQKASSSFSPGAPFSLLPNADQPPRSMLSSSSHSPVPSSFDLSANSSLLLSRQEQDSLTEKPPLSVPNLNLTEEILLIPTDASLSHPHPPRNGTRDYHSEVRDWIQSASSSSSVAPALSSSSNEGSRWGSRSGSLSSHANSGGCSASHHDVMEMWTRHDRRRSSQMSDASRRSSSSKHSSDLGTDLEEISETLAKQGHTVIEEENVQSASNWDDLDNVDTDEQVPGVSAEYLLGVGGLNQSASLAAANSPMAGNTVDYSSLVSKENIVSGEALPPQVNEGVELSDRSFTSGSKEVLQSQRFGNLVSSMKDECESTLDLNEERYTTEGSFVTLPSKTITFETKESRDCDPVCSEENAHEDLMATSSYDETIQVQTEQVFTLVSNESSSRFPYTTPSPHPHSAETTIDVLPDARDYILPRNSSSDTTQVSPNVLRQMHPKKRAKVKLSPERNSFVNASRYLFSDVASAPADQMKYEYRAISPMPSEDGSNFRPYSHSKEKSILESIKAAYLASPLVSLFISNLAKIAINGACVEGASIAPRTFKGKREDNEVISDEIYSMFATDIVSQVFVHILTSVESRDSELSSPLRLPSLNVALPEQASPPDEGSLLSLKSSTAEQELALHLAASSSPSSSSPPTTPSKGNACYLNMFNPSLKSTTSDRSSQRQSAPPTTLASPSSRLSSKKPKNSSSSSTSTLCTTKTGICKTVSFEDTCVDHSRSDLDSPISVMGLPLSSSQPPYVADSRDETQDQALTGQQGVCTDPPPVATTPTVFQAPNNASGGVLSSSSSLSSMLSKEAGQPSSASTTSVAQSNRQDSITSSSSLTFPPPAPSSMPRLLHSQSALELSLSRRYSLTASDADLHKVATAVVSQVFQSISDGCRKEGGGALAGLSAVSINDASSVDSSHSATVNNYRWGHRDSTFPSNIFSSSPVKSHNSRHSGSGSRYHCQSPIGLGIISRKPMSREGLTNAYLKVDSTPNVKTYERRSSEPCHTSVQLSLQAFNDNRFSCNKQQEEMQAKLSCTDDEIHPGRSTWRRGSLDGFTFERRRNSCGFKDPVLSRFAEELMKADTSVPELVIFGSRHSSSTTGSRRSSISGFKDTTLANLESELLNTSFTSICSLSLSQSPRSQHRQSRSSGRSRSWEQRQGKSDSSDTEHLFPLPRYVGDEFLQEYRKQYGYEDDDDDDDDNHKDMSVSTNSLMMSSRDPLSNNFPFQSEPELQTGEERAMETFANRLTKHILSEAFSCHQVEGQGQALPDTDEDQPAVDAIETSMDAQIVVSGNLSHGAGRTGSSMAFFGQGARPKISTEARRTSSKARTIPQHQRNHRYSGYRNRRRDDSGGGVSSDGFDGAASVSSESIFHPSSKRRTSQSNSPDSRERGSFIPMFKRLMSQEKCHQKGSSSDSVAPLSSATSLSSAIPLSGSLPAFTMQTSGTKAHHRRHHALYKSVSVQLSGSSSDVTSSSTPSIAGRATTTKREQRRRRASSETSSSFSQEIFVRVCDHQTVSQLSLASELCHNRSMDSVLSSGSDCSAHSGQTRSSLLSSSLSDSEGSSSRTRPDNSKAKASQAERKKRMIVRQAAITKDPTKSSSVPTTAQGRARRDRGRKRILTKPRPKRISREMANRVLFPKEDAYTESLTGAIMANAFKDFTQLKWNLFKSYERPIATGNWGCGAFKGNVQLKLVLQWLAASVAKSPVLLYYPFGDSRLSQAKDVVCQLSTWSVGELSTALRDYCKRARCHISEPETSTSSASWIHGLLHLKIGCGRQASTESSQVDALPISLFDYLLNFQQSRDQLQ